MDVDNLKAILEALQGTDVSRLDWTDGTQRLTIRLGHPPASTTSVHTMPMGAGMPGQMGIPTPMSVTPTPFASVPVAPAPAGVPTPPAQQPPVADNTFTVNSPFVGTFYRSASPDNPPFVEVGSVVKKGQVLCIVEAMKLMNEIEAERPGRLVEAITQNGSPVEYGEALFRFEPA